MTRAKLSSRNGEQIPNAFEIFHVAKGVMNGINEFCLDHEIITWNVGLCRNDKTPSMIPIVIEYKPLDRELKKLQGRKTVKPGENE